MKRKRLRQLKNTIEKQLMKGVTPTCLEVSEEILPCNYRLEVYDDYIEFETQFTQVFKGRLTSEEKQDKEILKDNNNYLEFRIVGKKFEIYLILDNVKINFGVERDYIKLNI